MKTVIMIPARYGSTRLKGKPLVKLAGKTMLSRVVAIAKEASEGRKDCDVVVATDDQRIVDHCKEIGAQWVMTPVDCPTGSDRVLAAAEKLPEIPDYLINLQGDAPLTPPSYIAALLDEWEKDPFLEMVTPVVKLSWKELDDLRERKKVTPFSGTSAVVNQEGNALWFSKQIIPAIRKEARGTLLSPVLQHVGLYGYRREFLEKYVTWKQGAYEQLEGLEQLRVLENGHSIRCVHVEARKGGSSSGVDSPEDVELVENLLINA